MEDSSTPSGVIPARVRNKALVAIGLLLTLLGAAVTALPFLMENTLKGTQKVSAIGVALAVFLFGLNALLSGLGLIRFRKWTIFAGVGLLFIMLQNANKSFSDEEDSTSYFTKVAEDINREEHLPRMENGIRLERVAVAGKMLNFVATMPTVSSMDVTSADAGRMVSEMKKVQCEVAVVRETIGRGGSVHYRWVGKDGGRIAELLLMHGTCERN